jgi:hypothetical protein
MGDGDLTRWEVHMKKIFVVLALAFAFITASAAPRVIATAVDSGIAWCTRTVV